MVLEPLQRCGINTSSAFKNPDFQFNRSLTRHLKLPVTFCKPFAALRLLRQVRMYTPAKCAKTFVDLVMTLPPVPITLTSAFIHYTFDASITHLKVKP